MFSSLFLGCSLASCLITVITQYQELNGKDVYICHNNFQTILSSCIAKNLFVYCLHRRILSRHLLICFFLKHKLMSNNYKSKSKMCCRSCKINIANL